tara:strand:- start:126 stop:911 length:786 start_codon:yes stop_codon:yes gene_type:complete
LNKISTLILAAGKGSRLMPYTKNWPKCLMPIGNYPLLEYWLSLLNENKICDVYINLHSHHKVVEKFLKRKRFKNMIKTIYEEDLLGTAGTLFYIKDKFKFNTILIVHADNWSVFNLGDFIDYHLYHRPKGSYATMMTFDSDNPQQTGIVETDKNGIITNFYEKISNPPSNRANAAVYLLERKAFDLFKNQKDITDFSTQVIPKLLGNISTWHNNNIHKDIGTIETLRKAQKDIKPKIVWQEIDDWYINFQKNPIHKLIERN